MENPNNKSLISTAGSNLDKTEKLLSVTQKILSEIKPQYESVKIGNQEWMPRNLDVDRFRNGDLIPHVESNEEWEEAGRKGQLAWCYYDIDPENGKKYGKLYNWYSVNDPRGLAPKGWHVPSDDEWTSLVEFLGGKAIASYKMKSVEGWEDWEDVDGVLQIGNGANSSGFNGLPGGFRNFDGSFLRIRDIAYFWSANEIGLRTAWGRGLCNYDGNVYRDRGNVKSVGASVRCLKDY